jgi:hypothetical protein
MTGHWPDNEDSIPDSDKDLLFTVTFQVALEPTQPPIKRIMKLFAQG